MQAQRIVCFLNYINHREITLISLIFIDAYPLKESSSTSAKTCITLKNASPTCLLRQVANPLITRKEVILTEKGGHIPSQTQRFDNIFFLLLSDFIFSKQKR